MLEYLTTENLLWFSTVIGILGGFLGYVYKKVIKPVLLFINEHHTVVSSIETIKKEVTTNGGSSIKDAITSLKNTCDRIELRQKKIEERSKLALHFHNEALFEIDKDGNLVWTNEKFYQITGENQTDLQGLNWIGYVQEGDREKFEKELKNCLKSCRKFELETKSTNGTPVRFIGFPYRIGFGQHVGFLFNLSLLGA
jgi:PAS domain S-box-containing protein